MIQKTIKPGETPFLKTVEQMSKISGIGENKLRQLIENQEIDYIENGNRRLLTDDAIRGWYERNKITAKTNEKWGGR